MTIITRQQRSCTTTSAYINDNPSTLDRARHRCRKHISKSTDILAPLNCLPDDSQFGFYRDANAVY